MNKFEEVFNREIEQHEARLKREHGTILVVCGNPGKVDWVRQRFIDFDIDAIVIDADEPYKGDARVTDGSFDELRTDAFKMFEKFERLVVDVKTTHPGILQFELPVRKQRKGKGERKKNRANRWNGRPKHL